MNILIIGGTGLVGPYLLQELAAGFAEAKIGTVTRSGRRLLGERAFQADRNDTGLMSDIVRDFSPDVLIDMIPFTVQDVQNTVSLVQAFRPQLPVVAVSSIDVYAAYAKIHGTEDVAYQPCPIAEDMALRQVLGAEGVRYDKLNVERIYREGLENCAILRFPAVYGWPDRRRVGDYLEPILEGRPLIEIPEERAAWKFSRCLHRNAAYAVFKTLESGLTGQRVYNVAEETVYSDLEWARKIAALCGWQGQITVSGALTEPVDLKQDFVVSTQKIRQETGFTEKYSPEAGLAENVLLYARERLDAPYAPCY